MPIHPTAVVHPSAQIAADVDVQPYAIIGANVTIGAGSVIFPHTVIQGSTVIGSACKIGPAAYIGLDPQHLEFLANPNPPATWLEIGDRTIIRESTSVHRSFKPGRENATRVGSDSLIMGLCHIAHDCKIADRVILANGVLLAGHVSVGEKAFLGGGSAVHQYSRIGRLAIISGNEPISRDVPPFAAAKYGGLKGYNAIGCRRAGMPRQSLHSIRAAYHCFHSNRTMPAVIAAIKATVPPCPEVDELLAFFASSKRGVQMSVRFFYRSLQDDDAPESA